MWLDFRHSTFFRRFKTKVCAALSFAFFIFPSQSLAKDMTIKYKLAVQSTLIKLQAYGFKELGGAEWGFSIPIEQILEEIQKNNIKYVETLDFNKLDGATRWTAFFSPTEKTVYINHRAHHHEEVLPALALHETLGALGLADPHYQVSLAAYFLTKPRMVDESKSDFFSRKMFSNINLTEQAARLKIYPELSPSIRNDPNAILYMSNGGGNRVGGAGDEESLLLKIAFIEAFARQPQFLFASRIYALGPEMQIELSQNRDLTAINYEYVNVITPWTLNALLEGTIPGEIRGYTRRVLRIVVPRNFLFDPINGEHLPMNSVISDIIYFIEKSHLFPLKKSYENCRYSKILNEELCP